MFEEDNPTTTYKSTTEPHLFWQLFTFCVFAAWSLGGNTPWAPPFIIAIGMVGIILHFMHGSFGHGQQNPSKRFIKNMWPLWFSLTIALIGLYFYPIERLTIGKTIQYSLATTPWWLPVNIAAYSFWMPLLLKACLLIAAFNIIEIAESEYVLKRLMIFLTANAMILALVGYIMQILETNKILLFMTAPHPRFFSTFTHPDHWGAFALLWSMVALGIIAHLSRIYSWRANLANRGVWIMTGTLILISTLFSVPSPLYYSLFCVGLGITLIHTSVLTFKQKRRKPISKAFAWILGGVGVSLIIIITSYQIQSWAQESKSISQITPALTETSLTWSYKLALYKDAWSAFLAKPIFGWGDGSFAHAIAFFQNADTSHYFFASAHSDILEILVENGLLGAIAWFAIPGYYLTKFFRLKIKRTLSYYLFGACLMGLIASLVDFPFQNPAFAVSFWIIFFSAYRWSELANK